MTYEADKDSLWTLLFINLGRCMGVTCLQLPTSPSLAWAGWLALALAPVKGPLCLCADGHLLEPDAEYLHWLV